MKTTVALAFLAIASGAHAKLVAWFPLDTGLKEALQGVTGRLVGDAVIVRANNAQSVSFGGRNGALFFSDSRQFAMEGSFSVSARVWVRDLPRGGTSPAGQIVFRGDDRGGLDNYSLSLSEDGVYGFSFFAQDNQWSGVHATCRKGVWKTLLGTYDSRQQVVRLYLDGVLVSQDACPIYPFAKMEPDWTPGFAIGNVQNPLGGVHNQPFNGSVRDVRLWNECVGPDAVGVVPELPTCG